jgi:hypothetical protein
MVLIVKSKNMNGVKVEVASRDEIECAAASEIGWCRTETQRSVDDDRAATTTKRSTKNR